MGILFGPYRLLRRIGLGDLAEVFVATRQADDEWNPADLVAVKRLNREMARYAEVAELFAREGEVARLMNHLNVVHVVDVGSVGDRAYIAMEYVPGADLAHLVHRVAPTPLPVVLTVKIILDMCEALQYVHTVTDDSGALLRVVHGDITPTNILVSTTGDAKLIDFSVSSRDAGDGRDTTVRGTYAYMSPEQVRGQPIDRRSDVFSLGVVFWELLTGRRLFRRNANYLTLAAVVEEPVPGIGEYMTSPIDGEPSAANASFDSMVARLDQVIARALAKNRRDRFADTGELAAELRPLVEEYQWDLRSWILQAAVRDLLSEARHGRVRTPTGIPINYKRAQ